MSTYFIEDNPIEIEDLEENLRQFRNGNPISYDMKEEKLKKSSQKHLKTHFQDQTAIVIITLLISSSNLI